MRFVKDQHDPPTDDYNSDIGRIYGYYRPSRYQDIIDILRNEKPVSIAYSSANDECSIKCGGEPVGEEET